MKLRNDMVQNISKTVTIMTQYSDERSFGQIVEEGFQVNNFSDEKHGV